MSNATHGGLPSVPRIESIFRPTLDTMRRLPAAGLAPGLLPLCGASLALAAITSAFVSGVVVKRRRSRREKLQAAAVGRDTERQITWDEFRAHGKGQDPDVADSVWVAIHGKVYDIAAFALVHPGGPLITSMAGRDASDVFMAMHMARVQRRLPPMLVGVLTHAPEPKPVTRDYRALRARLWKEGWFECDMQYVAWKDVLAAALFLFGLGVVTQSSSALARVLVGGCSVGIALQQVAFVAHDAGHNGIKHCPSGGGFNWCARGCHGPASHRSVTPLPCPSFAASYRIAVAVCARCGVWGGMCCAGGGGCTVLLRSG